MSIRVVSILTNFLSYFFNALNLFFNAVSKRKDVVQLGLHLFVPMLFL